jgi:hypothetical protein
MKRSSFFMIPLFLIALSADVFGQTAKDALAVIKQLQQRCETGILYKDYSQALTGVESSINLYLHSPESQKAPEFSKSLSKALMHYENAESILLFRSGSDENYFISTQDPALFNRIKGAYPELKIYEEKGFPGISYDEAIQVMWAKAASDIEKASDNFPVDGKKSMTLKEQGKEDPGREYTTADVEQQISALKEENKKLKKENKELRKEIDRRKAKSH